MPTLVSRVLDRPAHLPERGSRLALTGVMLLTGTLHLVIPKTYDNLIPAALGNRRAWVIGSGLAELTGGALLAVPRTRRLGAWWAAALFLVVWPGNVYAAAEGGIDAVPGSTAHAVLGWLRVPLQIPLIAWALRHTRDRTSAR